ncbi:PREDICTED: uncharacterized protein LOC107171084 [Diuraphis noxia]|uniref:uncharacterized protein LOC107171084 n=1 Tax=Diuraphis noxia TaxID=143948 RepID=UPI0007639513|nr:PREDICTED: uncharacterized protein LOC107171084 [Diuraphis noxia]
MAIFVRYLEICRICLSEDDLIDILQVGNMSAVRIKDINKYFNIQIIPSDENKSRKLCVNCIRKVYDWRRDVRSAAKLQFVIDTFDKMARGESMASKKRNT